MSDWQQQLGTVIQQYDQKREDEKSQKAQNKKTVDEFINDTALPALKSLASELEQHSRETEIGIMARQIFIRVLPYHGDDEFIYGLEIRHGHVTPYTERVDTKTGRNYRGESFISGDVTKDTIQQLSSEDIINDFLQEFSRYLR